MEDGRWEMGDGRWKMEDGRWEMGDGRWKMNLRHLVLVASHQSLATHSLNQLNRFQPKEQSHRNPKHHTHET
jgi:hypothetical protein